MKATIKNIRPMASDYATLIFNEEVDRSDVEIFASETLNTEDISCIDIEENEGQWICEIKGQFDTSNFSDGEELEN